MPFVLTTSIIDAADGWLAVERGVAAVMVVGVKEVSESRSSFGVTGVRAYVGPFVEECAV